MLLDNLPEYLFAFGGAALAGAAVVGLNHTRRGEHLLHDLEHTHCGLVITEPKHLELLAPIADRLPPMLVVGEGLDEALAGYDTHDPGLEPPVETTWALIFTSGTSDAPKAVICSQRRPTSTTRGSRWRTCSRSRSARTTRTTRCASRSATKAHPRWWRASPAGSVWR